jgi:hypothetical protein
VVSFQLANHLLRLDSYNLLRARAFSSRRERLAACTTEKYSVREVYQRWAALAVSDNRAALLYDYESRSNELVNRSFYPQPAALAPSYLLERFDLNDALSFWASTK